MSETLVWCTCSICSLNDDSGSWKLKSTRVRHQNRDKRNALSPNSDLELQSSIQKQDSCDFYQETFKHELHNIEYVSEFDNKLRNNNRLESTNKFEDGLEKNNEFERFESIDESEYELENNIEFGYELENKIDEEFENWSESESSGSNDSYITNMTFADNEEPFISSELASMIRLLKIKVQYNLTDEAFYEIMKATIAKPMSFPSKIHDEHLAYTRESGQDFYFPSTNYKLSQSELRKIKQHFSTISDVSGLQLISFSHEGTKYGRLRTKDGHYIGSKWIHRNEDWSRINYTVMVKIEVDIYANYPNRPLSKAMLAYIQWTSPIEEDDVGVKMFKRLGAYAFINASAIDHCIGFIEIGNLFYIVDKEVDNEQ
ncbi:2411_t:CDS:2 [Dentiscutata erythropus]|uniref:2411_t:CDS:1 n=1 Tax=Dentiscutata erythropus TaxID=1348616 RepID=A0A9N9IGL9_9GLOM|nr:2411_t:CDS:2 [Dentiscutata erythropus]